ncbi:DNA-binding protein [Ramicandelaber brevisporus]|nr:DNA-binding protein [Ramicandelaber brevisporus]
MSTASLTRKRITLRGSTDIVVEFFEYGINNILFQRGLYPPEDFQMTQKYGLGMLMTTDESVKHYLRNVLDQLDKWLMLGKVQKVVLAINSKERRETIERWQFDIQVTEDKKSGSTVQKPQQQQQQNQEPKSDKQIMSEIQAVMRQITASVSLLPLLEEACTFNILVYADNDTEVPTEWGDSDPHLIHNSEQVRLRSFSTDRHKVDAMVAYRHGNAL